MMFVFNRYDCLNNEYVCVFSKGTHHVYLMNCPNGKEVFTGHYEACRDYVENKCIEAAESMF